MNRRDVVLVLFAIGAAPLTTIAQAQSMVRRIGFLTPRLHPSPPDRDAFSDAFVQGMRALGYIEGKNLVIVWRYGDEKYQRLPELAAELTRMDVEVIVAYGTAAVQAAQGATKTIPIVIAAAVDPVGSRLVASLPRPGGNTTGLSAIAADLSPKHLEFLKTIVPKLARVAVLINPANSSHTAVEKNVEGAGKGLGIEVISVSASTPNELGNAFASASRQRAGAIVVAGDAFFSGQGKLLANASVKNRMPAISIYQDHVAAGGLMSYGQNIADFHRQSAGFVDKILKGAKPEDLPVEQPTKIELHINGRTAKALGLTIPQSLLQRAEEVIR
jgi:putative ABC transport system substrate-binding protein